MAVPHAVRLVMDAVELVHLDLALPPTRPVHPFDLIDLAGVDHQHPVCPVPIRPLVAQSPIGFVPVEEIPSGPTFFTS